MTRQDLEKNIRRGGEEDSHPTYLRGYCRICNRHYFYRHQLDTEHVQFHQHHGGVCQKGRYKCATVKSNIRV
ncbi:MAG: hypothetical protein OEW45_18490 [Deltaproteobacteria bacterium]|nr:hypothetical protein [Deltaproteobacteria bacterium]